MKKKNITKSESATTAENLEDKFDRGESVVDYFETETKRVGVDFPPWAIRALDREAARRGITRQALIKGWIIDRLDEIGGKKAS